MNAPTTHINCLGIKLPITRTSVTPKNCFRIICVIISGRIVNVGPTWRSASSGGIQHFVCRSLIWQDVASIWAISCTQLPRLHAATPGNFYLISHHSFQDTFDHDKGQKSAISGRRLHWRLSTGFFAFSPVFMCNLVRRAPKNLEKVAKNPLEKIASNPVTSVAVMVFSALIFGSCCSWSLKTTSTALKARDFSRFHASIDNKFCCLYCALYLTLA